MTSELRCRRYWAPFISAVLGSGGCRTHLPLSYECPRLGIQQESLGPTAHHPLPDDLPRLVDVERRGQDPA